MSGPPSRRGWRRGADTWRGSVCSLVDRRQAFSDGFAQGWRDPLVARVGGGAGFGGRRWCGQLVGSTATVKSKKRQSRATVKGDSQGRQSRAPPAAPARRAASLRGVGVALLAAGCCLWSPLSRIPRRFVARREPSRPGRCQAGSLLLATGLVRLDTAQSGMVVQAPPKRRGIRDNPGLWEGFPHHTHTPPGRRCASPSGPRPHHRRVCPGFPVASACFRKATMRRGIRDEGDHKQRPPPSSAAPTPRSEAARRAGAAGGALDCRL
ncbi:hypothetical protein ABIA35_004644 [Catenulispora sp. MAP12-49]